MRKRSLFGWLMFSSGCTHLEPGQAAKDTSEAADTDTDTEIPPPTGFLPVRASTFEMGCTEGQTSCDPDETLHTVTLTHDYWVGVTEATQDEFGAVMGYNPSFFGDGKCGGSCPVEQVSWHEAAAFANEASHAEGLPACYSCTGSGTKVVCAVSLDPYECGGYRLLTESEWEGAARCGEDLLYAGSDDASSVAWIRDNSRNATHAVQGLDPNACGLYDMSGNVWEWTGDGYGAYPTGPVTNPRGDAPDSRPVFRGGAFGYDPGNARVAKRGSSPPTSRYLSLGLRLARSIP